MSDTKILITKASKDYELLDSGDGEKLERFGNIILSRSDPQAIWKKNLSNDEWKKAQAVFSHDGEGSKWLIKEGVPGKWTIDFGGLKFFIKPTAFKHTGLFPEQLENWEWMKNLLKEALLSPKVRDIDVLNLFAYTGGASLVCTQSGAKVTHVDGSKSALSWAKENAELSGLEDKPIRWILDDVRAFVKREIKREKRYDAIIMDPPAFGHGAKKELWKIEEHFLPLIDDCMSLLVSQEKDKKNPLFFIINGYASGYSSIAYKNNLLPLVKKSGGNIEMGELAIEESKSGRLLPAGIFARWGNKP